MKHLKSTVILETIGKVDVSTIDLSHTGICTGFETCLFFGEGGRNSEVVETYGTWQSAVQGHASWIKAARLARRLAEIYSS